MTNIVTSLPISPRASKQLGYFLTPFAVQFLSELCQADAVYPVNLLGSKEGIDQDAYWRSLSKLGIETQFRWRDSDELHIDLVRSLINEAIEMGSITSERQEILRCPCGKLEILSTPDNVRNIRQTRGIEEDRGPLTCLRCERQGEISDKQALLLRFPGSGRIPAIYPKFLVSEYVQMLDNSTGIPFLLSRTSGTAPRIDTAVGRFGIDVDFFWSTYLVAMHRNGRSVLTLVCGHKQIRQVAMSMLVSRLFGVQQPNQIVLLPWIKMWDHTADEFPPIVSRFLLMYGLDLGRKVIQPQSSLVYWIEHSLHIGTHRVDDIFTSMTIDTFFANFHGNMLNEVLAACRKRRINSLSETHKIVLSFALRASEL